MRLKAEDDTLYNGEESEEEDWTATTQKKPAKAKGAGGRGGKAAAGSGAARTRPTNNQLQYKACFRWQHDSMKLQSTAGLLLETDPCPSVTSCFLQVLEVLHNAEQLKLVGPKRNVLQILSTNTRRTKVVELSSGTHRVPDELRKHYLSDGEGGQYSTNLDRNRYGNDDNYLFTVIRYDLEFLGWCPCMVDVEIIDAKAGNSSTIVQCGLEACTCSNKAQHMAAARVSTGAEVPGMPGMSGAPNLVQHSGSISGGMAAIGADQLASFRPIAPVMPPVMPPAMPSAMAPLKPPTLGGALPVGIPAFNGFTRTAPQVPAPVLGGGMPSPAAKRVRRLTGGESPKRSNSGVSGLFDVLVMAATGEGAEGAAAAGGASEPPVTSALHALDPCAAAPLPPGAEHGLLGRPAGLGPGLAPGLVAGAGGTGTVPQAAAGRFGSHAGVGPAVVSGGIAGLSGPGVPGAGTGNAPGVAGSPAQDGAPTRRVHRPPVKTRSRLWSALSQGELDSLQNALDAYVKTEEDIVSKPFGGLSENLLAPGPSGGAPGDAPARTRRRKPPRGNSSFLLLAADSMGGFSGLSKLGLSLGFKETSDDNLNSKPCSPLVGLETGEAGAETGAEAQLGKGAAAGEGGDEEEAAGAQRRRHVRHVPRQFSSVNVMAAARVSAPDIKRMASELESLREENKALKEAAAKLNASSLGRQGPGTPSKDARPGSNGHLFNLEQEVMEVRAEIQALARRCQAAEEREQAAHERARQAEERSAALTLELAKSRAEVNILMSKLVGVGMGTSGSGQQQGLMGSGPTSLSMALNSTSSGLREQHQNGKTSLMGNSSSSALDTLSAQLAQLQQQQQQQQQAGNQAAAMAAAMQQNAAAAMLASQQGQSGSGMSAQTSASVMALLGKGGLGFGSTGGMAEPGFGGAVMGGGLGGAFHTTAQHTGAHMSDMPLATGTTETAAGAGMGVGGGSGGAEPMAVEGAIM